MKIAYNPSDCNPLSESDVRRSNDIIFDLAGNNIYVKGNNWTVNGNNVTCPIGNKVVVL